MAQVLDLKSSDALGTFVRLEEGYHSGFNAGGYPFAAENMGAKGLPRKRRR